MTFNAAGWFRMPLFAGLLVLVLDKGVRFAAVMALS
jgi:membrane protein YqaA with SNARE-associated domain